MAWIYLAESGESAWPYHHGLEQSPIVREIDIVKPFSCLGCHEMKLLPPQYGTTSPHSYLSCCPDRELTLSPADSPARISALRELERVWEDSEAHFILKSSGWLANFNPVSFSLKTRQLSLLGEEFESYSDLPRWGMNCRWSVISAAELGAPHRRERWFLLAHTQNQDAGLSLRETQKDSEPRGSGEDVEDAERKRLQEQGGVRGQVNSKKNRTGQTNPAIDASWWSTEPDVGRVANGVPLRTHRIKGLGNAVVPLQARTAFARLMGLDTVEIKKPACEYRKENSSR